jgi:hypothetical protein
MVVIPHPQTTEFVPVEKIYPLPPGAAIELTARFSQGLSVPDFLNQWGQLTVKVVYEGGDYSKSFDEGYMRRQVTMLIPGAGLGPRVTKKTDDQ